MIRKTILILSIIMQVSVTKAQEANGVAAYSGKGLRMECAVSIRINSTPEKIWKIMTKAKDFPKWNSTIISLEGEIALKEKIKLVSTVAPDRTFKIKVSKMQAPTLMQWSDGFAPMFLGVRSFITEIQKDGSCIFTMREVYSGLMLPMIKKSLPDFRPSFEQFVADLKTEVEKN